MSEDRTEKATPKRRKEARKEGQVARTAELASWLTMLLASLVLPPLAHGEVLRLRTFIDRSLAAISDPTPASALRVLGEGATHAFVAVVALGSMVMVVGVLATVAQGGVFLATKLVKPSWSKLSLLKGFKRVFGPHTLWEGAKMLLKVGIVALVVKWVVGKALPHAGLAVPIDQVVQDTSGQLVGMLRTVAIAGLVMAAADYAMARRRTGKQTRMTKSEIKQEHKQAEGDPLVKGAIRSRQLAAARQRMMTDIAQADVVLVNPTHVAVALRYEPERGAPVVVGRGAGVLAARIRELAGEHDVPLVRDVPLARALYGACQVGQPIPVELFAAVAQVLAFVISRRTRGQRGGQHASPRGEADLPPVPAGGRHRRRPPSPAAQPVPAASSGPVLAGR